MSNKRQQFRVPYGKELVLRMADDYLIAGKAGNINDGGFLLTPHGQEDHANRVGQQGVLIIELQVERLEIPCQIVRCESKGLGIQFSS
jgi:hypothetical protein